MTDPVRQVESERKYEVDAGAVVPAFDRPTRARPVEELDATYYDSADRRLTARRVIARRRRGGHDAGWHVKLPRGADRIENRWPDGSEPPAGLLDLVGLTAGELVPVARLRTRRRPVELLDDRGGVLAEVVDDEVRSTDHATGIRRRWREWEVELGPAAPESPEQREALLDDIEAELVAAGARRSALPSKLVHAVAPSAPRIVVDAVAELAEQLDVAEAAAIADEHDAVHQARILVRRLRSILATHRRHFDGARVRALREQLRELGLALGRPRDLEVRARRAVEFTDDADREWAEYRRAHADLVERLGSGWHRSLRGELRSFIDDPRPKTVTDPSAQEALLADLRRSCAKVLALADEVDGAEDREAALHEVRKKARRVRYSAELQLRGGPAPAIEALAAAAQQVQNALGEHRDDIAFADYLDSVEQYGLAALARQRAEDQLALYPAAMAAFAAAVDAVGSGPTDIL